MMRFPIKTIAIWTQGTGNSGVSWIFFSPCAMFLQKYTKSNRKQIAKENGYKYGFVVTKINQHKL